MTRGYLTLAALWVAILTGSAVAQAPAAPADVVERLARLEEGQRSLEKRLDDFRADMDRRFEDVNRRFEDINRRFDELRDFIIWGFGVTFAGMFTLIGFVLWDRRTALAPAV